MTSREKKALCIAIPGSLFIAWRMYAIFGGAGPNAVQAHVSAGVVAAVPAAAPATSPTKRHDARLALQAEIAAAPWGRDPFADTALRSLPATAPASQKTTIADELPPALHLSGISEAQGRRIAIVNSALVRKGMVLEGGLEVTDITARSVVIRRGPWEYEFRLGATAPVVRELGK